MGERQNAVFFVGVQPAMHQAWDGNGHDAFHGDAVPQVQAPGGGVGRGAGSVGNVDSSGILPVDHDEAVAADAGHHGFNHVKGSGGGNGRVHGVAALLQNTDARLRRQRMAGADHTVPSHNHRPVRLKIDAMRGRRHGDAPYELKTSLRVEPQRRYWI